MRFFTFLDQFIDYCIIALDYPHVTCKDMSWPQYSTNLNPCDFSQWDYLKDAVYRQNSIFLAQLKQIISHECAVIPLGTVQNVTVKFLFRLKHAIAGYGGQFREHNPIC
ncbi:hypothetical protein AVEN_214125-1 [Araneus ventricosus]|uniref:Uncharacterized protein n=1 Tax=Araneus ventricosus TaxID=182803 RepID=A0A4Y2C9P4_ARAVE|nr:hypothetical protein AVEN_214125-1 [Araneus ventricosus]